MTGLGRVWAATVRRYRVATCLLAMTVGAANADSIALGTDYFQTTSTVIDFGGSIGSINFTGNPIGPGNTDTIIQRQADLIIGGPVIPIQLTALSLKSSAPVNIGGTFFDVFVTLDPASLASDKGTMSATGSKSGGTLDAILSATIIAGFHSTGSQETVQESVSLNFIKVDFKNTAFGSNDVQQVGFDCDPSATVSCSLAQMAADQNANVHTGLSPDEIDLFTPLDATVPLPATVPLFASGLITLGLLGWRGKRKAQAVWRGVTFGIPIVVFCTFIAAPALRANTLSPGGVVAPDLLTLGAGSTLLATTTQTLSSLGTYEEDVYSDPTRGGDLTWLIEVTDANGIELVGAFSFGVGVSTDVGIIAGGTNNPSEVERIGDIIGFSFTKTFDRSSVLLIETNATGFTSGGVSLTGLTTSTGPGFAPVATPLPVALPLLATGIGGLGLLGWRRKRKALAL